MAAGTLLPVKARTERSDLGRAGEHAALSHYLRRGYRLLARNWTCPIGELDLVFVRGSLLVFCEVKARSGDGFGGPHEAVTWKKQRKLRMLAEAFLAASGVTPDSVRFDVASVSAGGAGRQDVFVFEAAF